MSEEPMWRRSPEVLFRLVENEAVLYVPSTDGALTLDPIGTAVWQVLELPGSLAELVAPLAELFEADSNTIEHDVAGLLAELSELGVVERAVD